MLRDNIARIRHEPSLLAIEVAWRWIFGAVALALLAFAFFRLQHAVIINPEEDAQLHSMSPESIGQALILIAYRAIPVAAHLAAIIVPALLILWTIAASIGRAAIMAKLLGQDHTRLQWSAFIGVHALRALSVLGLFVGYLAASFGAAVLSNPENPNYLLSALVFLVMFVVVVAIWMWVHWVLSIAAIYPIKDSASLLVSLKSAFQLVQRKPGELAGIATGNGTARSIVALVFTFFGLLPLPLYPVAPGLLTVIEIIIALAYCVVSDWFLLARLVGYMEVATAVNAPTFPGPAPQPGSTT